MYETKLPIFSIPHLSGSTILFFSETGKKKLLAKKIISSEENSEPERFAAFIAPKSSVKNKRR